MARVGQMTTGRGALGQTSWPELDGIVATLLVPLGATEQHGPHLPLDTDTRIADAVTREACARVEAGVAQVEDRGAERVLLSAPPLSYGASGEHEGFPGTVSIGHEALRTVLVEYGRSACRWADRVVFVNGHGGNIATLIDAVRLLRYEGRDAAWFACATPGSDAHAGHTETSVLMHLSTDLVHRDRIEKGNVAPLSELFADMRSGGVAAVSPNGVLGDPSTSTPEHGEELLEAMVTGLVDALTQWDPDEHGRIR